MRHNTELKHKILHLGARLCLIYSPSKTERVEVRLSKNVKSAYRDPLYHRRSMVACPAV